MCNLLVAQANVCIACWLKSKLRTPTCTGCGAPGPQPRAAAQVCGTQVSLLARATVDLLLRAGQHVVANQRQPTAHRSILNSCSTEGYHLGFHLNCLLNTAALLLIDLSAGRQSTSCQTAATASSGSSLTRRMTSTWPLWGRRRRRGTGTTCTARRACLTPPCRCRCGLGQS